MTIHVVQALASDASDQALHVAILPRAFRCDLYLFNPHPFNSRSEMLAVDPVAISNHVPRRAVIRKRLDNLLCSPYCRGMLGDIEMEHASASMGEDNKHVEDAQPSGRHREEIDRYQLTDVIAKKGQPRLRRL